MRLKELRKNENLKQKDFAKLLNIPITSYIRYETGEKTPNLETLIKLADHHNVNLDYLVGRDFNDGIGYLNNNEKELIKMFREMNQDNQLMFFAEAKGILLAQN